MVDVLYSPIFKVALYFAETYEERWKQTMIAPHNIAPHL